MTFYLYSNAYTSNHMCCMTFILASIRKWISVTDNGDFFFGPLAPSVPLYGALFIYVHRSDFGFLVLKERRE